MSWKIGTMLVAFAFAVPLAGAAPTVAPASRVDPIRKTVSVKPSVGLLPPGEKAAWQHSPYAAGDCSICHERDDKKNPGKVNPAGNELCLGCHEEFATIMKAKYRHKPVTESCISCHNPHESRQRKLLHAEIFTQCTSCHVGVKARVDGATVKHDALTTADKCLNCHNPHASNVEKLLTSLPYDQCVNCHGKPDVKDDKGVLLTNFKELLEKNKVHHAPVAAKDCSACHEVHGGENYRLLVSAYPAKFYAPFDPATYALCFGCHNDKVVTEKETTTLTNFRDGARNLHFLHVNKPDRGRTCRACHEVHAAPNAHQIREAVPYGPKGWLLKVGFTQNPDGGTCSKTCHDTKSYVNRPAQAKKK